MIAYSTISQIGYMFVSSMFIPKLSIYHIITHAIFKCMLFLMSADVLI